MRTLIIDVTCPKPYDPETLATEGMGGTEATVIRIAEGLAKQAGHSVGVFQHNRSVTAAKQAEYYPFDLLDQEQRPDNVIVLRSPIPLAFLKDKFPDAKFFLWLHDLVAPGCDLLRSIPLLEHVKPTILGVSQSHKTQIMEALLRATDFPRGYTVDYVYNPIDEELAPNETPIDKNRLVFFSSPHKGLAQTLTVFRYLRSHIPDLTLEIGNPGYTDAGSLETLPPGVTSLGKLPHSAIIQRVRGALAVLYPNTHYGTRETFGLVFAEANAVGTPVLTHRHGSASEILSPEQVMDCNDIGKVKATIDQWRLYRPLVLAKPEYRLGKVLEKWENLFRK